jgi:cytochrome b561
LSLLTSIQSGTQIMNTDSSTASSKYGSVAQAFHWATAIAVLAAFILGPGGSEQHVYAAANDFARQWHETLGLSVFALSLLRILWRTVDTHPQPVPVAPLMAFAAKAVQVALYCLLFTLPLTAILGAWLEGHPLTLLAGLQIQAPFGAAHPVGVVLANLHTLLGDAILWLAGFHALAAIFHHVFLQDGVLSAMLPTRIARAVDLHSDRIKNAIATPS